MLTITDLNNHHNAFSLLFVEQFFLNDALENVHIVRVLARTISLNKMPYGKEQAFFLVDWTFLSYSRKLHNPSASRRFKVFQGVSKGYERASQALRSVSGGSDVFLNVYKRFMAFYEASETLPALMRSWEASEGVGWYRASTMSPKDAYQIH